MSEEIIFIEEENKKSRILKILFKKEKIDLKFISKVPVLFYSIIISLFLNNLLILLYGIFSYLLVTVLSRFLSYIFFNRLYNKKSNLNYGRIYYTELGYTPKEFKELIINLLFISIFNLILNFTLFSIYIEELGSNSINLLLFLLFSLLPFIILVYVIMIPIIKESEFFSKVSKELPIASMLITAFSAANIHPYSSISSLGRLKLFPYFNKIFKQIEKLKIFLALSPNDAISLYSRMLKDESLKKLLQTISAMSLGSGIYAMMKEYMKEIFKVFEKKIEEFIDRFNILLAAKLIVFILLPLASLMTLIFMQGDIFSMMLVSLFLIPSIFFILFLFMIQGYALPFMRMSIKKNKYSYLLFSLIPLIFIINAIGLLNISATFFFISIAITFGYYLLNRKSSNENERLLNELPNIIRDITEEVKKGNGLYQAIDKIHDRYEYAGEFLKKVSFLRMMGISMEEILERERFPNFFKQVFIALDECDKVGLDSNTMEEFSDFVNRLDSLRKVFKIRTRFFRFSSYMITALLGFSLGITVAVLGNLISTFIAIAQSSSIIYSFGILNLNIPFETIKEIVFIAGYLNSLFLGFLGGYAEGNSVEGCKNAMICALICFISINLTNSLNIFKIS